jgi:hypothetical protein
MRIVPRFAAIFAAWFSDKLHLAEAKQILDFFRVIISGEKSSSHVAKITPITALAIPNIFAAFKPSCHYTCITHI